jgi:hypothetical protein
MLYVWINHTKTPNDQELSRAAGDFRQPETLSANLKA